MTAAFVACNELAFGNLDAADRNLRGIKHFVKVRGGLHNLGMGGVLATIISGVPICRYSQENHTYIPDVSPPGNFRSPLPRSPTKTGI